MNTTKPILCVDFDGVIHSYTSRWVSALVIKDPPVPGAIAWLEECTKHFSVCIYSSRSKTPGAIDAMATWLYEHGLRAYVEFPTQKPAAFLTIDDRCIQFNGHFEQLHPENMLTFKPWNKR